MTLVELMVVVGIVAVLTGLAAPVVLSVRQTALVNQAMADLRAVDMAIQASCGKGRCGNFTTIANQTQSRTVPNDLKEFLPLGFKFQQDTSNYAFEINNWLINNVSHPGWPLCRRRCMSAIETPTWTNDDLGFTNSIGFTAPPTIYTTVIITSRSKDVLNSLYNRIGWGSPPVFNANNGTWSFFYPVLAGVLATG